MPIFKNVISFHIGQEDLIVLITVDITALLFQVQLMIATLFYQTRLSTLL